MAAPPALPATVAYLPPPPLPDRRSRAGAFYGAAVTVGGRSRPWGTGRRVLTASLPDGGGGGAAPHPLHSSARRLATATKAATAVPATTAAPPPAIPVPAASAARADAPAVAAAAFDPALSPTVAAATPTLTPCLSLAAVSLRVPLPRAGGPGALRLAALAALATHGSPVRWAVVGVEAGVALVDAVVSVP